MLMIFWTIRNSFIALVLIVAFFSLSHTCDASLAFRVRKLIAPTQNNGSTPQVAPSVSPADGANKTAKVAGETEEHGQKESQVNNHTNTSKTLPNVTESSNGNDKDDKRSSFSIPPAGAKSSNVVDRGNEKADSETVPKLVGCVASCRDQKMIACVEASKGGGSEQALVVQNEGESTLTVKVNMPNYLTNDLPALEVAKHETKRMDISSIMGKSTELIVDSGKAKCTLQLARPISADNLIQQLSFYSKQVTPVYAAYAFFLLALLFGGIWACCKLRKTSNQQNGIPYQELEMGLPESVPAGNAEDAVEGWDHDWDDDDWEEGNIVKSPAGPTLRPGKKDGWEDDWED
ncbi:Unknown protein [Striga hermonthica]|uniref:DUF7356 domain-containing protein n=1 Tax=Striga hermonthica TaxID=68872 RepID=A0A9N7RMD8_STRHE|nr:Unknown protein [Striga hermonthica]